MANQPATGPWRDAETDPRARTAREEFLGLFGIHVDDFNNTYKNVLAVARWGTGSVWVRDKYIEIAGWNVGRDIVPESTLLMWSPINMPGEVSDD